MKALDNLEWEVRIDFFDKKGFYWAAGYCETEDLESGSLIGKRNFPTELLAKNDFIDFAAANGITNYKFAE